MKKLIKFFSCLLMAGFLYSSSAIARVPVSIVQAKGETGIIVLGPDVVLPIGTWDQAVVWEQDTRKYGTLSVLVNAWPSEGTNCVSIVVRVMGNLDNLDGGGILREGGRIDNDGTRSDNAPIYTIPLGSKVPLPWEFDLCDYADEDGVGSVLMTYYGLAVGAISFEIDTGQSTVVNLAMYLE